MNIQIKNTSIIISDSDGSILSYKIGDVEFMAPGAEKRPLFMLKLLMDDGSPVYYSAKDAEKMYAKESGGKYILSYTGIASGKISAEVTVTPYEDGSVGWTMSADNGTNLILESMEVTMLTVPDALKAAGGDYKLFWPGLEGLVIDDAGLRDKTWIEYHELGIQSGTFSGYYPGSCTMQFMAYYNDNCGIYYAAHDATHNPKAVEYHLEEDGIHLELRKFCGGAMGKAHMGYEVVTAPFVGDWHDAADIYRNWMEENVELPKKLYENEDMPKWLKDSPIVTLYPVRGTCDTGDMSPNMYYPYKNALPYIDRLSEKTDSKLMALLMHWEGTAPWAPPYVWPPYGGEEQFRDFVSALHEKGHLAGVYCSGIAWTTKSCLVPELDYSDKYDDKLICTTPQGTHEQSWVIAPPIRHGYDMCPHSEKVDEIVSHEVVSIAKSGCDYVQFFDQNLGGAPSLCYARDHGHPPAPGQWENDDIIRIFKKTIADLNDAGLGKIIMGCECAAAEPFIKYLPFSDLRYPIGLITGNPVPAYAYLFHEYLNNFMGNQCACDNSIDRDKTPYSMLYRVAYSFAAGDLLTIVLRENGQISWAWGSPWDVAPPEQEPIFTLMKNLNLHRREFADYLHYGKMVKPKPVSGAGNKTLYRFKGDDITISSVLSTRWKSKDGKEMQVLVNWQKEHQTVSVDCKKVYASPENSEDYSGSITIAPLSAIWVE